MPSDVPSQSPKDFASDFAIHINTGPGGSYTAADGTVWEADGYYHQTGTKWGANTNDHTFEGTNDDFLYQTERWGLFEYSIPVPEAGDYLVRLHFAETTKESGKRIFDVEIEGELVLHDYDIFAIAGGKNIAVIESFVTAVNDGTVTISFLQGTESWPKICAIEVEFLS
jgi:hypothetical protein